MNARGFIIVFAASAMMLVGCAVTPHRDPTSAQGSPTDTPTPSRTATADPLLVDPASYPLPSEQLSEGMKGVMFTAGGTGLQCAIFDPIPPDNTVASPPEFGCEVSVDGFPYPPVVGGSSDTANAFLSSSHQAAIATNVADATFSGDTAAPALPAGKSIVWSTVTCAALAVDEVRCTDATSGHGMRVSIRDYDLF
jgi:hypothetical protein